MGNHRGRWGWLAGHSHSHLRVGRDPLRRKHQSKAQRMGRGQQHADVWRLGAREIRAGPTRALRHPCGHPRKLAAREEGVAEGYGCRSPVWSPDQLHQHPPVIC